MRHLDSREQLLWTLRCRWGRERQSIQVLQRNARRLSAKHGLDSCLESASPHGHACSAAGRSSLGEDVPIPGGTFATVGRQGKESRSILVGGQKGSVQAAFPVARAPPNTLL